MKTKYQIEHWTVVLDEIPADYDQQIRQNMWEGHNFILNDKTGVYKCNNCGRTYTPSAPEEWLTPRPETRYCLT